MDVSVVAWLPPTVLIVDSNIAIPSVHLQVQGTGLRCLKIGSTDLQYVCTLILHVIKFSLGTFVHTTIMLCSVHTRSTCHVLQVVVSSSKYSRNYSKK